MKSIHLLITLGALILAGCTSLRPPIEVKLFNGQNLEGWAFTYKNPTLVSIWSVKDGVIHCQGAPNGYARTIGVYENYSLHVEWRWPENEGNSGVLVHVSGEDKVWPRCIEVQLKSGQAGSVLGVEGERFAELTDPKKRNLPLRTPGVEKPVGAWNFADIICRDNTLTVSINGVIQNTITGATISRGHIAVQSEGAPIEFRNLTLRSIAPTKKVSL